MRLLPVRFIHFLDAFFVCLVLPELLVPFFAYLDLQYKLHHLKSNPG